MRVGKVLRRSKNRFERTMVNYGPDSSRSVRGDILFGFLGSSAISIAASPEGTVVAPNAEVSVENVVRATGAVMGKYVTLHEGAVLTSAPFTASWVN